MIRLPEICNQFQLQLLFHFQLINYNYLSCVINYVINYFCNRLQYNTTLGTSSESVVVIGCFRSSKSPDSGISSLPSPVSLLENCLTASDAMVLRSHRLVRSTGANDLDGDVKVIAKLPSELCCEFDS